MKRCEQISSFVACDNFRWVAFVREVVCQAAACAVVLSLPLSFIFQVASPYEQIKLKAGEEHHVTVTQVSCAVRVSYISLDGSCL